MADTLIYFSYYVVIGLKYESFVILSEQIVKMGLSGYFWTHNTSLQLKDDTIFI